MHVAAELHLFLVRRNINVRRTIVVVVVVFVVRRQKL